MNLDSGFDNREFKSKPYLKLIEDKEGGTCLCYQMLLYGKLHFVKKIKPEFENDPRMRAAFRKENEIGFSLSHPNLPRYVFMEGIFSPEEYVVTEWIEGLTLEQLIETGPKFFEDKGNLNNFVKELLDGIEYLHSKGIIHSDLKPSNIMVSTNGHHVGIVDLGYAVSDSHQLSGGFSQQFASPQVLAGKTPEFIDDYYSIGKILQELENKIPGYSLPYRIKRNVEKILTDSESQRKKAYLQLLHPKSVNYKILSILLILTGGIICSIYWFFFSGGDKKTQLDNSSVALTPVVVADTIIKNQTVLEKEDEKSAKEVLLPERNETKKESPREKEKEEEREEKTESNVAQSPALKNSPEEKADSEEGVRKEVRRRLEFYFPPIVERIDSLASQEIFTEEWGKIITRQTEHAVYNTLNIKGYMKIFPDLEDYRIGDILSEESCLYLDSKFYPKYGWYHRKVDAAKAHR